MKETTKEGKGKDLIKGAYIIKQNLKAKCEKIKKNRKERERKPPEKRELKANTKTTKKSTKKQRQTTKRQGRTNATVATPALSLSIPSPFFHIWQYSLPHTTERP